MDINLLCGYGVWSEDNQRFDADATTKLVESIHDDWKANPEKYKGVLRKLPSMGMPPTGGPTRSMLWEAARKVLGKDIESVPQQVGDCVGVGSKHAIELVQMWPILNGQAIQYTEVFSPYHWGMGRLATDCGNNQLGTQDGSMGAWQAKAIMEYGVLALDAKNTSGQTLPPYSGVVARQWGNMPGPSMDWITLGETHVIENTALVNLQDELAASLCNGYPVTVASTQGFTMLPQADGFHHPHGEWGHQMCIIGIDLGDDKIEPHGCILNNWGDVHGQIVDFRTGENWPTGTLRVRLNVILSMIGRNDSFAYSTLEGFPSQTTPRALCDPW